MDAQDERRVLLVVPPDFAGAFQRGPQRLLARKTRILQPNPI